MNASAFRGRDLLLAAAVLQLLAFGVFAAHCFPFGWQPNLNIELGAAASAAGSFATASAIFFALWQFVRQRDGSRSEFMMAQAMRGLEQAYEMFLGVSNIDWVHGARLLTASLRTGDRITETDHKLAWEQHQFLWRRKYLDLAKRPIDFFFGLNGASDNLMDEGLRRLAERSRVEREYAMEGQSGSVSTSDDLAPEALIALVRFIQFPSDFDDPLDRVGALTKREFRWLRSQELYSLYAYLNFQRRTDALGMSIADGHKPHPDNDPHVPE
jgi:hypothetical protein